MLQLPFFILKLFDSLLFFGWSFLLLFVRWCPWPLKIIMGQFFEKAGYFRCFFSLFFIALWLISLLFNFPGLAELAWTFRLFIDKLVVNFIICLHIYSYKIVNTGQNKEVHKLCLILYHWQNTLFKRKIS